MALCVHHTVNCTGGRVVHSYGRLIPHEFPITDLHFISGPDGFQINCTDTGGGARFQNPGGSSLVNEEVMQIKTGAIATLAVKANELSRFQNRDLYCNNSANFFYLFLSSSSKYVRIQILIPTTIHNIIYCTVVALN